MGLDKFGWYNVRRTPETVKQHTIGDAVKEPIMDDREIIYPVNQPDSNPNKEIWVDNIKTVVGHHIGKRDLDGIAWKSPESTLATYRNCCELGDMLLVQLPPIEDTKMHAQALKLGWDGNLDKVPPLVQNQHGDLQLLADTIPLGISVTVSPDRLPCWVKYNGIHNNTTIRLFQPVTHWYENLWDAARWQLLDQLTGCGHNVELKFYLDNGTDKIVWTTHACFTGFMQAPIDEELYAATLAWGKDLWQRQQRKIRDRDRRDYEQASKADQAKAKQVYDDQIQAREQQWEQIKQYRSFYTIEELIELKIQAARNY